MKSSWEDLLNAIDNYRKMKSNCSYCNLDTAGNHQQDCPANPKVYKNYGWLCPSCGRGNAPWVNTCPCVPLPPPQVWC